jgi:hypothetical protein
VVGGAGGIAVTGIAREHFVDMATTTLRITMPTHITAMGTVQRLGSPMAEADTHMEVVVITSTEVDAVVIEVMHTVSA